MIWSRSVLLLVLVATTILPASAQSVQSPRYNGVVQSVADGRVTLADGRSFAVIPGSRFNRVQLRGMASENVMNNATIEEIGDRTITFRLPGGSVTATFPPDTPVVAFIEPGVADDLRSGAWISALVDADGAGQHIYVEYP